MKSNRIKKNGYVSCTPQACSVKKPNKGLLLRKGTPLSWLDLNQLFHDKCLFSFNQNSWPTRFKCTYIKVSHQYPNKAFWHTRLSSYVIVYHRNTKNINIKVRLKVQQIVVLFTVRKVHRNNKLINVPFNPILSFAASSFHFLSRKCSTTKRLLF